MFGTSLYFKDSSTGIDVAWTAHWVRASQGYEPSSWLLLIFSGHSDVSDFWLWSFLHLWFWRAVNPALYALCRGPASGMNYKTSRWRTFCPRWSRSLRRTFRWVWANAGSGTAVILLAGPSALSVRRSDYVAPEVNQTFNKWAKKCVCGFVSLAEICILVLGDPKLSSDLCAVCMHMVDTYIHAGETFRHIE